MSRRVLASVVVLVACSAPVAASAEPPAADLTRAENLFRSAKQIRDAGLYSDACSLFAQSDRLSHGVGVSLYLADCDEHLGRTATAWNAFREAEKLARQRGDKRAELAHARAEALARHLSGLTIVVPESAQGAALSLDGAALAHDSWNVPLVVDPGEHTVTVTSPGAAERVLTAHVCDGNRNATLIVPEGAAPVIVAPPAPEPKPAPASSPSPAAPRVETDPRRWVAIGLLTGGAVGIAAGAALFLGHNQGGPSDSDESANTGAAVAVVLGGALIAAGISLTITPPSKSQVGLLATPVALPGGGGAVLQGGF